MLSLSNVTIPESFYMDEKFGILQTKYHITDMQQLYDLVYSGNVEFNRSFIKRNVNKIVKKVNKNSQDGMEPEIFRFDQYEKSGLPISILEATDRQVEGNILPLFAPTTNGVTVVPYTISKSKELLQHTLPDGTNAFGLPFFTTSMNQKIVNLIYFYEQQVIRQYKSYKDINPNSNIFAIDFEKKRIIIEQMICEIIDYLLGNGEVYIWGSFSDSQKNIFSKCHYSRNQECLVTRNHTIDCIASYITLEEAEDDIIKTKVLDRFIK